MKLVVSALALTVLLVAIVSCGADKLTNSNNVSQQQQQPQQPQQQQQDLRQGRSLAGNGNSVNNLNGNSNMIEHSSSKSRIEQDKRQVQEFLTTRNIFKQIMKLLFGNPEEISATSRTVLGMVGKMLEILKNTFGHKSRSGTARTLRDSAEDAANAGVSMLQGYVKAVLANDDKCVQRHLCQASKEAARDGRDLGYFIASAAGYASSYLLDSSKSTSNFKSLYEASMRGRSMQEDCAKLYASTECNE